jgi:hypothetical protein
MDNIDDLMRQKFDADDPAARFEFQEEYWEQAQALLEQREARRRKRRWMIWILVLGLVGWLGVERVENVERVEMVENVEGQTAGNQSQTGGSPAGTETPANASQSDTFKQITPAEKTGLQPTAQENASGKAAPQSPIQKNKSDKKGLILATQENRSERTGAQSTTQEKKGLLSTSQETRSEKNSGFNPAQSTSPAKNQLNSGSGNEEKPGSSEPPLIYPNSVINPQENPSEALDPALFQFIPQSIIRPNPVQSLPRPANTIIPKKSYQAPKPALANTTKIAGKSRFSFGISLAGVAYQQTDTMGSWAGWTFGALGGYRLNQHWSLSMGLQWRMVPIQARVTESSGMGFEERVRYSFGYKRESLELTNRGLHYLELPLAAQWTKQRWGLEAGVSVGKLIAVENSSEYTVESSLEPRKTTRNKYEKGDLSPYEPSYFSSFVGANYRLNNRISLTTKAQYRFTPISQTLRENTDGKGLGNLELGLRYRLY